MVKFQWGRLKSRNLNSDAWRVFYEFAVHVFMLSDKYPTVSGVIKRAQAERIPAPESLGVAHAHCLEAPSCKEETYSAHTALTPIGKSCRMR